MAKTLERRVSDLERQRATEPERVRVIFRFEGDPWIGPNGEVLTEEEWQRLYPYAQIIELSFGDDEADEGEADEA